MHLKGLHIGWKTIYTQNHLPRPFPLSPPSSHSNITIVLPNPTSWVHCKSVIPSKWEKTHQSKTKILKTPIISIHKKIKTLQQLRHVKTNGIEQTRCRCGLWSEDWERPRGNKRRSLLCYWNHRNQRIVVWWVVVLVEIDWEALTLRPLLCISKTPLVKNLPFALRPLLGVS